MKLKNKITLGGIVLLIALFAANYFLFGTDGGNAPAPQPVAVDANAPQQPAGEIATSQNAGSTGEALIGGSFSLTDFNNQPFSSDQLKGKYSIIYFGFSNCPSICPTAMNNISLALTQTGEKAAEFVPVFITVDPDRDTAERLKEWLPSFSTSIIGLTGTKEQLAPVYDEFKVYAQKIENEANPQDPNYNVDHTSIIYIMDKEFNFVAHFTHESKIEDIAAQLKALP